MQENLYQLCFYKRTHFPIPILYRSKNTTSTAYYKELSKQYFTFKEVIKKIVEFYEDKIVSLKLYSEETFLSTVLNIPKASAVELTTEDNFYTIKWHESILQPLPNLMYLAREITDNDYSTFYEDYLTFDEAIKIIADFYEIRIDIIKNLSQRQIMKWEPTLSLFQFHIENLLN